MIESFCHSCFVFAIRLTVWIMWRDDVLTQSNRPIRMHSMPIVQEIINTCTINYNKIIINITICERSRALSAQTNHLKLYNLSYWQVWSRDVPIRLSIRNHYSIIIIHLRVCQLSQINLSASVWIDYRGGIQYDNSMPLNILSILRTPFRKRCVFLLINRFECR